MKEGRKPEYPEKTPDDELLKMPHTKARISTQLNNIDMLEQRRHRM